MQVLNVGSVTNQDTLLGKGSAERDFPLFEQALSVFGHGETVVWDWSEVKIATASYFAGTFVKLLKRTLSGELDLFLLLAGLNENCRDEFMIVVEKENLVILVAEQFDSIRIKSTYFLGTLDESYREAFAEAEKGQAVSAAALYRKSGSRGKSKIGKTAWINRLTNLNRFRLLRKTKIGRQFVYELPF